jgi:hypothetical protein
MTWIVEDAWTILAFGAAVQAILAVILVQSGRRALLFVMAAVLLVTVALLFIEWLVVTDGEQIESVLNDAAAALESDDLAELVLHIATSPEGMALRRELESRLDRIQVTVARIASKPQITINEYVTPRSATATFMGRLAGNDRTSSAEVVQHVGRYSISLVQHGNEWRVSGYDVTAR